MQTHEFGNATTADLWIALGASSKKDVSALAKAWTEQPGFPLVSVTASCDAAGNRTVALAQKRFLLDGTTDTANTRWNVPVALASGTAAPAYVLLTDAQQSGIPAGRCGEPLRANAGGVGYYRVAYDAATFETNRAAFASLPDADKIAMLGDQWNLVRIGAAPLPSFLALSNAMGSNRNARAWQDIVGPLAELEDDTRGTAQHDAFTAYARNLVAPLAASLGWDAKPGETVATGQLRRSAIGALGAWGDPAVIAEARTRFDRAVADPASTPPDMLAVLTAIVGTNADAATFDRLHQLAQTSKDPTVAARYRGALMHVRDPKLAARALDIAMSAEVPPQQQASRFGMVATSADWNPKLAWAFFQAHSTDLTKRFSLFEKMLSLSNAVPAIFWDAATPNELEGWLKANLPRTRKRVHHKGHVPRENGRRDPRAPARRRPHVPRHGSHPEDVAPRPSVTLSLSKGAPTRRRRTYVRISAMPRQTALFASAASPTRLVGDHGDVTYVPEFLDRALADAVVRELRADTQWRADSRMMYGKRVLVPRETAGRGDKMPQPWTPALALVRQMVERHTGTTFDYCFLNRYRDGQDAVAWHGDRDGTRDARLVVASLSLGATRQFQLRPKKNSGLRHDPITIDVAHGDLVVMAGDTQLYWEHRVPRDPRLTGERLNVTFRQHRARDDA